MKYAVDRIVEGIVILENLDTLEILEVSLKKVPKGVLEGSILRLEGDEFFLDKAEEETRRQNLRERIDKLKKLKG